MVSPITVIDETSNEDDEIILQLNLEMTIDDYDTDGRKNDALAEAAAAGRASAEKATAEAERVVATAKAAAERAAAAKATAEIAAAKAATEIAALKVAAVKAAAEITALKAAAAKAAAEITALKVAAAEITALKAAAAKAAAERAEARRHLINIHVAGRIYPSAAPHLSLTVRDGKVTLADSNDRDVNQHWYRFEKYSTQIKDAEGRPSIIFENSGTGLTLQHPIRNDNPVRLIKHNFNETNTSVLWTKGLGGPDGAFSIRNVANFQIELVVHNHNYQEGEIIKTYRFHDPKEHQYWKFTQWK